MSPLKGLFCVTAFTLALAAPAFAQSTDTSPTAPSAPTAKPASPSTTPADKKAAAKARKAQRHAKKSPATQGQPGPTQSQSDTAPGAAR